MSPAFRPAAPSDVDAAVPLIYSSGPDAFDFVFDNPGRASAQDFLRLAFLDGAGEFGYRNHVVATDNGSVVGIGAGWGAGRNLEFTLAAARQILQCYGLAAAGVIVRGLRTEAVIQPPAKGCLYIAHLGVGGSHQSKGIGSALIEYLIETNGGERTRASLDVALTNPRGQALYERLGFSVVRERRSTLGNSRGFVPGMRYMELDIPKVRN